MSQHDLELKILLQKFCFKYLLQMLAIQHHYYFAFLNYEISSCLQKLKSSCHHPVATILKLAPLRPGLVRLAIFH